MRRWIALPADSTIAFSEKGGWKPPAGTVLIQHFEMALDEEEPERRRRLETRILRVDEEGAGYGITYRWVADESDAELLSWSLAEEVPVRTRSGKRTRTWYCPSLSDCLACHAVSSGFVLGLSTRQLNSQFLYAPAGATAGGVIDNQLRAWSHAGMLGPPVEEERIPALDRLAPISDPAAPLELRVRSYLDANCSHCHRPGGGRALFDARFDTPLESQGILGGLLAAGDLGIPGARAIVPGDPSRSVMYLRLGRLDVFKMPPVATNEVDAEALAALETWIRELGRRPLGSRER